MSDSNDKTMNCEQALQMLFEFMDNELDSHNHHAMEQHMHACRSCFSRYEFEKRLKGLVGEVADTQASAAFKSRIGKIIRNF